MASLEIAKMYKFDHDKGENLPEALILQGLQAFRRVEMAGRT